LETARDGKRDARRTLEQARDDTQRLREAIETSRETFLRSSRDFRSQCLRLKERNGNLLQISTADRAHSSNTILASGKDNRSIEASAFRALLLETHNNQALSSRLQVAKGENNQKSNKVIPDLLHNKSTNSSNDRARTICPTRSGSAATSVTSANADYELEDAQQTERVAIQSRDAAQHALEHVRVEHVKKLEAAEKRNQRLERTRMQLKRLRNDCLNYEREIARLDAEATEARDKTQLLKRQKHLRRSDSGNRHYHSHSSLMHSSYGGRKSDTTMIKRYSATSSQSTLSSQRSSLMPNHPHNNNMFVLNNPYARRSHLQREEDERRQSAMPVLIQDEDDYEEGEPSRPRSSTKQHPHRSGRVRKRGQFSTALQIESGVNDNTDENSNTWDSNCIELNNNHSNFLSSSQKMQERITNIARGQIRRKNSNNEDDEDDDDDALLKFIPFAKKSC